MAAFQSLPLLIKKEIKTSCITINKINNKVLQHLQASMLSAAERIGTPVLLSASVSDNFGNSPQIAAPRKSRKIDQSCSGIGQQIGQPSL